MRYVALTACAGMLIVAASAFAAEQAAGTNAPGATSGSSAESSTTRSLSGSSSGPMGESQVKEKLQQEGFSGVTNLREESNGTWTGEATRGGQHVTIDVQPDGTINTK